MTINLGALYDGIATHYDSDPFGLLSSGRQAGVAQIAGNVAYGERLRIVDLGAGTGESLAALSPQFPDASFIAIDLSAEMLAIARAKLAKLARLNVTTIVGDAEKIREHVEPASTDLALVHYLTTFIDVAKTFRSCREILKPEGFLSVVSTTQDAFPVLRREIGHRIATEEELRAASPAPDDADFITEMLRAANYEIVAMDTFSRPITFGSFSECLDFGVKSGFFTHIIAALGPERIQKASQLDALFPIADVYSGVAILARRP